MQEIGIDKKVKFRPHSTRITNAPLGGSVTVVLVWIAALQGIEMPIEVAIGITSIVTYLVGWLVDEKE